MTQIPHILLKVLPTLIRIAFKHHI
jgi:hypothetical protein